MSIYVLKSYVEECFKNHIEPTFHGLNVYYKVMLLEKEPKKI